MTNAGLLSDYTVTPQQPVDLTNCDQEPIHIPGSIQPHGVLLAVIEPELIIVQVSANTGQLLGIEPDLLLNQNIEMLFEAALIQKLKLELKEKNFDSNPNYIAIAKLKNLATSFEVVAHRIEGLVILELEPVRQDIPPLSDLYNFIKVALAKLQDTNTVQGFCQAAAEEIKQITGFDRIMVYKFLEDESGHVIAEVKEAGLEPYFDLHYPASDIPTQARELYLRNPFRLIADVFYQPTALIPPFNPLSAKPLNQTYCWLRSVSPIHIEYLKNMGVGCSMSVSLIKDNRLWGLIACHHRTVKYLPFATRAACEFLGQVMSNQIAAKEENEFWEEQLNLKGIQNRLVEYMSKATEFTQGLLEHSTDFMSLLKAQGAAICYGGEYYLTGVTPTLEQIQKITGWLHTKFGQNKDRHKEVYYTDSLVGTFGAEAEAFKTNASGLMAFSLSRSKGDYVLWFRSEVIQTVKWAGEPAKSVLVSEDTITLHPRKSFELWKQMVQFKSLPWRRFEIEAAQDLRNVIIEVILHKAHQLAALNLELEISLAKERELSELRSHFLTMTSHEFRTPLTIILTSTELLKNYSHKFTQDKIAAQYQRIEDATSYMTEMLDKTLLASKLQTGKFEVYPELLELVRFCNELVARTIPFAGSNNNHPVFFNSTYASLNVRIDKQLLEYILSNLISNALKFSLAESAIYFNLTGAAEAGSVVFVIKDEGIGIPEEDKPYIYELFHRGLNVKDGHIKGIGLGLTIVKKSVESLKGKISFESFTGKGTTFTVSLPVELTSVI